MAAGDFEQGYEGNVEFTYDSVVHDLPVRGWSMTITGMTKNMHNARDGRKRIAGKEDVQGASMNLVYDGGVLLPRARMVGTAKLYTDKTANKFYELSIIIDAVAPGYGDFDDAFVYPVTFSLESGDITYPTYS